MPQDRKPTTMLKAWRQIAATSRPGARLYIDPDIPIDVASVVTTAIEPVLANAMIEWLKQPTSAEPWAVIGRALSTKGGDASYLAAKALADVCVLKPAARRRALEAFDRASADAQKDILATTSQIPSYARLIFTRAASTAADRVRLDAISRACVHSDRRLFAAVSTAARKAGLSAKVRSALERAAMLHRHGYWARPVKRGDTSTVFEVVVRGPSRDAGSSILFQDVPSDAVVRLGEVAVAAEIRRASDNPSLPWPIDWTAVSASRPKHRVRRST